MRAALVFPPYFISYQPYSSLPALGAYLRNRGHEVCLLDDNIDFICRHLRPSFFSTILQETHACKDHLLCLAEKTPHDSLLLKYIQNCFTKDAIARVVDGIDSSLEVMRNRHLLSNEYKANKARDVLNKAQNLLHQYLKLHQLRRARGSGLGFALEWSVIKSELLADSLYRNYFKARTVSKIVSFRPDLIGISIIFEDQLVPALILADEIKKTNGLRRVHVTIGGPVITILQDVIRRHAALFAYIDSCIVYEGEHALEKLLQSLQNNTGLESVPNLLYLQSGRVVSTERAMVADIDSLSTPDFDGLPLTQYFSPQLVPVLKPTRGCYWNKCTFCNNRYLNNYTRYRMRSPERIFDDFVTLHGKYNIQAFSLWEEAAVPKILKKLAELISRSRYDFKWFAEARLDKTYTEDFLQNLYRGGCRALVFGLESGNARIQGLMNKGYDLEVSKKIIKSCRKAGIRCYLTLMVGFPSETPQEALDTITFISQHTRYIFHAGFSHFGLRKFTATYDNPEKFGITVRDTQNSFSSIGDLNYGITNSGMTLQESMELYKLMTHRLFELGLTRNEPECHYLLRC